jgi:hypothetical protein
MRYAATKRTKVLRTTGERAGPEVMVGTDVRVLRKSSTHALRGRLSRRSKISSMGDWLEWVVVTRSFGLDGVDFTWSAVFIDLVNGACFRGFRDIGRRLCNLARISGFCHVTLYKNISVWARSGLWIGWESSFNKTAPTVDVAPTRSQAHLPRRGLRQLCLRRHKTAGCAVALLYSTGTRCATFHLTQPR